MRKNLFLLNRALETYLSSNDYFLNISDFKAFVAKRTLIDISTLRKSKKYSILIQFYFEKKIAEKFYNENNKKNLEKEIIVLKNIIKNIKKE